MLTRLQVDGFKNLDQIDVRFGPFTCVAGPNGAGKSNLFDAIAFLSALAERPLAEAAMAVRGGEARPGDPRNLFRRVGDQVAQHMRFAVELIIPETGEDDLGQPARASMTLLRYEVAIGFRPDASLPSMGTLEVLHESMVHINRSKAKEHIGFPHTKAWLDSVVTGRRTSPYISTEEEQGGVIIALHGDSLDGKTGGRPRRVPAPSLPRTVLSSASNAAEHRTLVLARREMASWTQLQLEPSALRAPDSFTAPRSIGPNGAHLAATLFGLAQQAERDHAGGDSDVYAKVAGRLSELVESARRISVDVDEKRQLLSILMTDKLGTPHVASALSDGTLRFLALVVMEADPKSRRLLCLEEPENGIHPKRIPAFLALLEDLAVDVTLAVDEDNPLRQVICNTHSPSVVACVRDDTLLIAGVNTARLSLRHLPGTWRETSPDHPPVTRGDLRDYLDPFAIIEPVEGRRRVVRRDDVQTLLPFLAGESQR